MYSNHNNSRFPLFSNVVKVMRSRAVFVLCCLGFHISNLSVNSNNFHYLSIYSAIEIILLQFGQRGEWGFPTSAPKCDELKLWEIVLSPVLMVA